MDENQLMNVPNGITLSFEPFCSSCNLFELDIQDSNIALYSDSGNYTCERNTIITCKWRNQCKRLKKMMEKKNEKETN